MTHLILIAIFCDISYNVGGENMIKYPNGSRKSFKSKLNISTSANRGIALEEEINATNKYYLDLNVAVIHKKPVPIQVVDVHYPQRSMAEITKAYYVTPSTTDYNGVYKGRAIDFEVKQTKSKTSFPFASIHKHQVKHLEKVIAHGAIAFIIIRFSAYDETYYVKAKDLIPLYYGKRRSIPYQWFSENAYLIPFSLTPPVDYLKVIDQLYFEREC